MLLPNGSWTGLRGQVQRGVSELDAKIHNYNNNISFFLYAYYCYQEVDLACSAFSAASFPNIFEMTIFVMGDVYGMLTQYPVLMTSNYGHYTTFSPQVGLNISYNMKNKLYKSFYSIWYSLFLIFKYFFLPILKKGLDRLVDFYDCLHNGL